MKEELRPIEEYPDYYISNLGNVYSSKRGELKKLNPYVDSKGNYLLIRLLNKEGKRKSLLIHDYSDKKQLHESFIISVTTIS